MSGIQGFATGDERGAIRAFGGVLLGVAVLLILYRRLTVDAWGDLVIFLVLLAPTLFLLSTGIAGARALAGLPSVWQTAFTVFGLLLLPLTLYALLNLLDGDPGSNWNTVWIFATVAVVSFVAALMAGVRLGCLLGSIATVVAWLALWDEVLTDGLGADAGTLRGLLLVAAALLLAVAAGIAVRGWPEGGASDVITVAGLAAVGAGGLALADYQAAIVPVGLAEAETPSAIGSSTLWELELLAVSLALVVYGVRSVTRGPAYVGGFGLFAFIFVVGTDIGNPDRDGSLLGWPLVLLIAAVALLAASLLPGLRRPPA